VPDPDGTPEVGQKGATLQHLMPRDALRESHVGITLNDQSSKMEERLGVALGLCEEAIQGVSPNSSSHIVGSLNQRYGKDLSVSFEGLGALKSTLQTNILFSNTETALVSPLSVRANAV
jgi:hypothetical protein